MSVRRGSLVWLVVLGLVDVVIPVPILGLILIYVIFERPAWFRERVRAVYGEPI
ncbi:MAG: hypothetical protein O2954_12635 [bacterium]|nr:hypothetical protein [bacterium]